MSAETAYSARTPPGARTRSVQSPGAAKKRKPPSSPSGTSATNSSPVPSSRAQPGAEGRAVLGPRTVVVLHIGLAQDLVQHEPGVRRALADPAVRDRVLAEVDARLVPVQGRELVVGLEGAILVRGLGPGNVLRGRDVAAALRLLLRQVGRGEQPPGELVRRPDVDEVPLADRGDHLVAQGAQ